MNLRTFIASGRMTQTELARAVGVSPGMVWQWINQYRRIAAEKVLAIEAATGGAVTRHDLRPDIYPRDQDAA